MKSSHSSIFAAISLLAILMSLIYIPSSEKVAIKPESKPQTYLYFDTTEALLSHYQSSNYQWPINKSTAMPMRLVQSVPKNIHQIKDRSLRKTLFIQIMLPIILAEQKQIQLQRRSLALLIQGNVRNDKIENQLNNLFEEYNIERTLTFNQKGAELLSQYDELPLTLILAQAAIESGWGRS